MARSRETTNIKSPKPRQRAAGAACFWVNNGPVVESIGGLKRALEKMNDEQFAHHTVNGNDFAAWLREVLYHTGCARTIARSKTKAGALKALATCTD